MDEFNASKIGSNLIAVSNFYDHRSTEIQKKAYPNMLGAANGYIISYLCLCENKDKNIFQRDIEREFDLSRSTVSTILKQLESEGLIERKSVIIDARLKKVVPTPAAEMINEACSKEITHFFYDLASNITDNEMSTFVKVLDTMKKNSERIRNDLSRDIF
uniref:MarR family transcriptional regulator n=1 Tax=Eubacterium sp. TaxID=142586 RepID=UPI004026DAF1